MRRSPKAQGRRVRLVVRRIEPWTVLKFSVLLYLTMYLIILVAGMALWAAATVTGVRGNVETFIGELIASDNFTLLGETVAKASILGGAVLVVMGTGANVLLVVLYNLISDVLGGVIVVFEERPGRRQDPLRLAGRGQHRRAEFAEVGEAPQPLQPLTPSRLARRRGAQPLPPREQSSGEDPTPQPRPERPIEVSHPSE